MTGLRRTFYAASAAILRAFAWLPFQAAKGLTTLADECEERAR